MKLDFDSRVYQLEKDLKNPSGKEQSFANAEGQIEKMKRQREDHFESMKNESRQMIEKFKQLSETIGREDQRTERLNQRIT